MKKKRWKQKRFPAFAGNDMLRNDHTFRFTGNDRKRIAYIILTILTFLCINLYALKEKPNIIVIMVDDMGYSDIGSFGATIIETPNLDALGEQGIRFTQFYNNAKCGPTRVSLMTGISPHRVGLDGASGVLRDNTLTLAEVLKDAGYNSLIVGKWHLAGSSAQHTDHFPLKRGFDRAYGLLTGASSYFELLATFSDNNTAKFIHNDTVMLAYPDEPDFYVTEAYNRKAVEYIEEFAPQEKPFFLYLAHQAPHYPLHAPEEDIQKYAGKFMIGWDSLRTARYARMREIGVIDSSVELSPRDGGIGPWEDATGKADWDRRMAVHAAMIDIVDRGVGMVTAKLKELGEWENTVILFLSDNGACQEAPTKPGYDGTIGAWNAWATIRKNWANAADTPYRKYKSTTYEGGMRTPFIFHWPAAIPTPFLYDGMAHVKDLFATVMHIAGAEFPVQRNGIDVMPHEGLSFAEVATKGTHTGPAYFAVKEGNNLAFRMGEWKVVKAGSAAWELYNMETDPTELNNLASANPGKVTELVALYDNWWNNADTPSEAAPLPEPLQIAGCTDSSYAEYNPWAEINDAAACKTMGVRTAAADKVFQIRYERTGDLVVFHISGAGAGNAFVSVYRLDGMLIRKWNTEIPDKVVWNTAGMMQGIYLVRVHSSGKMFTQRFYLL